ncbi:MAG: hypothetical protein ACOC0V_05625 [Oceanicaulis sp.]
MSLAAQDFALREPSALGALLSQDWRLRRLLTDAELVSAAARPAAPSVLRQLQRHGLIRALHGVRPQGGRMRVWTLDDAMRADAALLLSALSGASLTAAAGVLGANAALLDRAVAAWPSHLEDSRDRRRDAVLEGDLSRLAANAETLSRFLETAVAGFVARNRLGEARRPAFLL